MALTKAQYLERNRFSYTLQKGLVIFIGFSVFISLFSVFYTIAFKDIHLSKALDVDNLVVLSHSGAITEKLSSEKIDKSARFDNRTTEIVIEHNSQRAIFFETGVDANFFDTIGLESSLGARLTDKSFLDAWPSGIVISHDVWRNIFSSEKNIIGTEITYNGERVKVLAVMPENYAFPFSTDIWRLLQPSTSGDYHYLARLKPGVNVDQSDKNISSIKDFYHTGGRHIYLGVIISASVIVLSMLLALFNISFNSIINIQTKPYFSFMKILAFVVCIAALSLLFLDMFLLEKITLTLKEVVKPTPFWFHFDLGLDEFLATFFLIALCFLVSFVIPSVVANKYGINPENLLGLKRIFNWSAILQLSLFLGLFLITGFLYLNKQHIDKAKFGADTYRILVARYSLPAEISVNQAIIDRNEILEKTEQALMKIAAISSVAMGSDVPGSYQFEQQVFTTLESQGLEQQGLEHKQSKQNPKKQKSIVIAVSDSYFDTLAVKLISGRMPQLNNGFREVVVSTSFAKKFWPKDEVIGQIFSDLEGSNYVVVGLVKHLVFAPPYSKERKFGAVYLHQDAYHFDRVQPLYISHSPGADIDVKQIFTKLVKSNGDFNLLGVETLRDQVALGNAPMFFISSCYLIMFLACMFISSVGVFQSLHYRSVNGFRLSLFKKSTFAYLMAILVIALITGFFLLLALEGFNLD